MGVKIKIIVFILGIVFFLFVIKYIKKNSFKPSYSILWLLLSFFLISIPLFEGFYQWIATSVVGIIDARHIIYIVLIGFLLLYIFYLTSKITKMADQIQTLISFTAILEGKIKERNNEKD